MKNPWLENPPTPGGDLGQLDHSLMEELLTFCDFHSIISVGKTCHCLKERADGALDKCANLAFETRELNRSPNFDSLSKEAKARMKDVIVDCFIIENTQESGIESLIRYGWTNNHESKTNLTQAALQQCRKCIEYSDNDGLDTIYEEFRALSLLNKNITGGFADFSHFAVNPEDKHNDDIGWKVGIHHDDNMSRSDVAEMIRDWSYNYEMEHNYNDDGSDYSSSSEADRKRLMHFAFCLLRKADPTTLLFTKLEVEVRHSDYPQGECNWAIVFKLAQDEKSFMFESFFKGFKYGQKGCFFREMYLYFFSVFIYYDHYLFFEKILRI